MHRFVGSLWRRRIDWELDARPGAGQARNSALEKVENRLLTILEMVNEWLQFAEAKNAGLVALDGLALSAILAILPSAEVHAAITAGLVGASLLLVVSLAISLWPFLPRGDLGNLVMATRRAPRTTDNLFFSGISVAIGQFSLPPRLRAATTRSAITTPRSIPATSILPARGSRTRGSR